MSTSMIYAFMISLFRKPAYHQITGTVIVTIKFMFGVQKERWQNESDDRLMRYSKKLGSIEGELKPEALCILDAIYIP